MPGHQYCKAHLPPPHILRGLWVPGAGTQPYRWLGAELGGAVLACSRQTLDECLRLCVFGIQQNAFVPIIQHIRPGLPVRPSSHCGACRGFVCNRSIQFSKEASADVQCAGSLPQQSNRRSGAPASSRGSCLPGFPHFGQCHVP